ncbi:MAG: hypothetical protein J6C85_01515 [Alphaproteobacteria bacterium]|nr:hypothetical protein [Alphaproteobacteria bacterium]
MESVRINRTHNKKNPGILETATNSFLDRILRGVFVGLLVVLDFVMFVYSINGRIMENGVINEAMIYIAGGFLVLFLVIMLLLSQSGVAQDVFCAVMMLLMTIVFLDQFALFDVSNFIELWLSQYAGPLSFIGLIPSNWLVGLILGCIVFFAFRYTGFIFLGVLMVASSLGIGIYQTEMAQRPVSGYETVKELDVMKTDAQDKNTVYLMAPKFPSYHFLSTVKDINFRELRDMMLGFYAVNSFEVYPNAFVQKNDTVSNIVDIFNLVDYNSSTSGIRGYAEILNDWDFAHGLLDTMLLEENKLYDTLNKEGFKTSTYPMPLFNFCYKDSTMFTDRCVVKTSGLVSLYDKKSSLEKNIFALLGEWVHSFHNINLISGAKALLDMSYLKGRRVISENRRLSIEGAVEIFGEIFRDFQKDKNGVVYMSFVELPSDLYLYDEFCNLKPEKDWVALKDNSYYSGGIDLKRKAYADQAKCFIGLVQMFMEKVYANEKIAKTDIIVQGVSPLRELAGMPAGRYGNFVADKLVNLGIRRGKNPDFVINTDICLASDITRSEMTGEEACYSIDGMKLSLEDALNLRQNLINNSMIRDSKITNIAANYRDWYEEFKKHSRIYQKWQEEVSKEILTAMPEVKRAEPVGEVKPVAKAKPEVEVESVVGASDDDKAVAADVVSDVTAEPEKAEVNTGTPAETADVTAETREKAE